MTDLLAILTQSATSLSAQQAVTATASHNIQNASTPGYARQTAVLETTMPADMVGGAWIGRGAQLQTITQARDRFLEAQIPAQLGLSAQSAATSAQLASVSVLDPAASNGLGSALDGFYAALRGMGQNPSDPGLRAAAVSAARTLAQSFQSTRASLESARSGADAAIAGDVQQVNSLAAQVADLNGRIRGARATGGAPNDLLDARQKAVDHLAALTGVSPVPTSDGDVSLFLPGGSALVSGLSSSTLGTQADPANAGHLAVTLTGPGGQAQAFTGMGGQIGGALAARDGALKDSVAGLDTLAWDLGGTVNSAHQAGYGLDGTTGDALFTLGSAASGAAGAIGVNAVVSSDPRRLAAAGAATSPTSAAPGDASNLRRLLGTETTALSNGLTAQDGFARITSDFGVAASASSALAEHDLAMHDNLLTLRESASGVSIDEELIQLQKAQRGYQAISRVIQTASAMLDTLMSLKT
jgi:flagellar hook-associated protein 1 FlgK